MANSTTIKITNEVRDKLTDLKLDNEGYSVVIARLIEDNKKLSEDKEMLSSVLRNISVSNTDIKVYSEIISFIVNGSSENKLQDLKNYFSNKIEVESIEILEALENVKKYYVEEVPSVLIEFENYIKNC